MGGRSGYLWMFTYIHLDFTFLLYGHSIYFLICFNFCFDFLDNLKNRNTKTSSIFNLYFHSDWNDLKFRYENRHPKCSFPSTPLQEADILYLQQNILEKSNGKNNKLLKQLRQLPFPPTWQSLVYPPTDLPRAPAWKSRGWWWWSKWWSRWWGGRDRAAPPAVSHSSPSSRQVSRSTGKPENMKTLSVSAKRLLLLLTRSYLLNDKKKTREDCRYISISGKLLTAPWTMGNIFLGSTPMLVNFLWHLAIVLGGSVVVRPNTQANSALNPKYSRHE